MQHISQDLLQQYLANAVETDRRKVLEAHLAACPDCSTLLAELAVDDLFLSDALALSADELAWVESRDLTAQVVRQITPRTPVSPGIVLAGLALLPGIWMLHFGAAAVAEWLAARGPVNLTIDLGLTAIPALLRFLLWIFEGGLLARFWPAILLSLVLWFWRLSHTKETNEYA